MTTIRPYSHADHAVLRDLVLELHETLRPYDADLAAGEAIIDRYLDGLLSRVDETGGAVYLAEDEGRVVGYVCVRGSVVPDEPDERQDPYSFMAELFVRPELRRSGVGSLLVERAEAFAREAGAYKMELNVLARNASALRFYEGHGYASRVVVMSKRM
ncbi:GNAT family N-acetyltransferase [Thioalkalivibrio thiocyanodenitrificans]|uniref:GNAT family N-acetyltransferase n=1 Tax=Thioalkalivibrio thiocyanodenitrificans TaxID=243063 RepID=UPI00037304D6|nr:GNAT family N-acetyltransferase [Thioalkalivibrio thiocyanodenitrificans]